MSYQVSENTRRALILAAGELFAQRDVGVVSVREITAKAGVKVNAISYHFGGKDGLVDAVVDYALSHWQTGRFQEYYNQMESQLDTREGGRRAVIGLLQIYYDQTCPRGKPAWHNMFLLRLISDHGRGRDRVAAIISRAPLILFSKLFSRITGCSDPEVAHCWLLNVIGAAAVYSGNLLLNRRFDPDSEADRRFYNLIRYWGTRNALMGLGLYDEKRDEPLTAFDPEVPESKAACQA